MAAPGCPSTQLDLEVPTPTAQCTAGSGTPGGESDLAWRLVLAKAKSVSGPHGPLGKKALSIFIGFAMVLALNQVSANKHFISPAASFQDFQPHQIITSPPPTTMTITMPQPH